MWPLGATSINPSYLPELIRQIRFNFPEPRRITLSLKLSYPVTVFFSHITFNNLETWSSVWRGKCPTVKKNISYWEGKFWKDIVKSHNPRAEWTKHKKPGEDIQDICLVCGPCYLHHLHCGIFRGLLPPLAEIVNVIRIN